MILKLEKMQFGQLYHKFKVSYNYQFTIKIHAFINHFEGVLMYFEKMNRY